MWNYLWPLLLVVASNTVYHIASKSTPQALNPFFSLVITYLVGAMIALVLYLITSRHNINIVAEIKNVSWTSFILGGAIVGLEAGWIYVYRTGWKISVGVLTANVLLAVILVVVGALCYKEHISVKQVVGTLVCAAGLIIMNI